MWVPVTDVLPVKGEFKVKLLDGREEMAFYTGFHYVDKHTRETLPEVTHWFREKGSPRLRTSL